MSDILERIKDYLTPGEFSDPIAGNLLLACSDEIKRLREQGVITPEIIGNVAKLHAEIAVLTKAPENGAAQQLLRQSRDASIYRQRERVSD